MTTRTAELLSRLEWTQPRLAYYLGVAQASVSRMVTGQAEAGPVSRLLDALALDHGFADLTAERFAARQKQGDAA